jgi:hypothetical protein
METVALAALVRHLRDAAFAHARVGQAEAALRGPSAAIIHEVGAFG